jgi:hypothetical protein
MSSTAQKLNSSLSPAPRANADRSTPAPLAPPFLSPIPSFPLLALLAPNYFNEGCSYSEGSTLNCLPRAIVAKGQLLTPFQSTFSASPKSVHSNRLTTPLESAFTRLSNPNSFICNVYKKPGVGSATVHEPKTHFPSASQRETFCSRSLSSWVKSVSQ